MDFKKRINKAFDDVDKILQDGTSLPSKIRVALRHALENLATACTAYDDYDRGYLSNSRKSVKSSIVYSDSFDEMVQKDFTYKGNKYTWNDSDCVYYNDNGDEEDFFMEIPQGAITSAKKPIKSAHDRETLKKVIRAYLDKMGYKDVEGGVDAAADYILQNEEYYSDYDFHSKVKQWFKETKENYPETLIKASKTIKSGYHDTTIESAKSEFGYDAHETMTFDEFKNFVKSVVEPAEMFDYKGAYFVILNNEEDCKKLNNELDDTYGVGCTYYPLQDPHNEHYGKWQFMA